MTKVQKNKRKALLFNREKEFEYSDSGYCVLQLLIQETMNKAFEDAVQEMVFDIKFDEVMAVIDENALKRAIKIGACNIYHGCVHNMFHEKVAEVMVNGKSFENGNLFYGIACDGNVFYAVRPSLGHNSSG